MKENNAVVDDSVRSLRLKRCTVQMLSAKDTQRSELLETDTPCLYLVLQGKMYVKSRSEEEIVTLQRGDLLLLTDGAAHRLSTQSKPGVFCAASVENAPDTEAAPEAAALKVLSSRINYSQGELRTVFDFLPSVMLVRRGALRGPDWIVGLGRLMQLELDASGAGCDAILDTYLEMIFRELFEFATATGTMDEGVLRAIPDRRLIAALAAIHQQPADNWTVERLAATASMSRSLFARRFSQLIQDTPQNYLRRYRLGEAVRLLQETDASIEAVAEAVGYQSRSAFTKAFSRHMNQTPGRFRQSP